jgi:UDP-N-acetylglucosamine 2-epimerase (non-hydrolysing)
MVSEASGVHNLQKEGFAQGQMLLTGNIMIECLLKTKKQWESFILPEAVDAFYMQRPLVATFHRPENVDEKINLKRIVDILLTFSTYYPVVFPLHPRTRLRIEQFGLLEQLLHCQKILVTEPLSYFEFLKLVSNARIVITDSGGIQEETSFMNIPCITFRKNTERPITIETGTNKLLGIWDENFLEKITEHMKYIQNRSPQEIPLWDNEVSIRIINYLRMNLL